MSKKTKEILFWLVMLTVFVLFIFSFPSCSVTKRTEQAKYTAQTNVAEESVAYSKEDVVIKSDENDTSVIVTLTPMVDVPFSSTSEIYKGINSEGYKVKEVKIKTTNKAITTTTNQTQKIQTKKSANLTGTEITTTKQEKQNNRNILPFVIFASLFCLFVFVVLKKNNKLWK